MTPELVCTTRLHEVSIIAEPLNGKIMGLKIRVDGITKAEFLLADVWDFLKDALQGLQHPTQFLTDERRCYEASNIYRLTQEWIEMKEKKEQ